MEMADRHGASNTSGRYGLDKEDGWGPDAARWVAGRMVQGIRDGDGEKAGHASHLPWPVSPAEPQPG